MRVKYDIRAMMKEIGEDEKVSKSKPVLLSQQEIRALIESRGKTATKEERHDHVR